MPERSPLPVEFREAQATACLEAAALHKDKLLAVAERLAGGKEAGMDLFQQTCLNCHDAIQRRGYAGTEYRFYLLRAIKRLHLRTQYLEQLKVPVYVGLEQLSSGDDADAYSTASPSSRTLTSRLRSWNTQATAPCDERDHLAEQMKQEVEQAFSGPDRLALRLHLDGHSFQDISELVGGGDQSWIRRRVEKIKNHLRTAFGRAWANLDSE